MYSRDQVLALMRDRVHHPAGMRELLQILKVPRDDRTSFKRHIKSLVASGELIQIRGHRFGLPEKMDLYVGRLQTHPAGYEGGSNRVMPAWSWQEKLLGTSTLQPCGRSVWATSLWTPGYSESGRSLF